MRIIRKGGPFNSKTVFAIAAASVSSWVTKIVGFFPIDCIVQAIILARVASSSALKGSSSKNQGACVGQRTGDGNPPAHTAAEFIR